LRLETARRLLATEYLTLKQVMARVGLSDVTHFNRDFRKVYGLSPCDYRDRHCQVVPARLVATTVRGKQIKTQSMSQPVA
jgi:AraC-like DNA-binding protein